LLQAWALKSLLNRLDRKRHSVALVFDDILAETGLGSGWSQSKRRLGEEAMDSVKFLLPEERIPRAWYNIAADLPKPPPPPLHPGTGQPIGPADLSAIFPMALIAQEVSADREIEIPEPVREVYKLWRPAPLYRARRLERVLDTPARIFYKYEGVSPPGSHKPNTAVPQAFYNREAGIRKLSTETGAGQWGSSLAFAGQLFGLEVKVFMVKVSYQQKPYRRALMETYGATCIASPSTETDSGKAILAAAPNSPGSLGIAISEAVEIAAKNPDTNYSLGSVLNHVLIHQSVIGIEALEQMEMAGHWPDIVIGCTGGGSNFAGLAFPFLGKKLREKKAVRVIAAEPAACPSLTRGRYAYDFGDTGHLTPLVKMHTLGSTFIPPGFHAGGLRYHGMAPMVSHLKELDLIEARAVRQLPCFEAAVTFARTEGIVPAPEATHAIRVAFDEALRCKAEGKAETILFNLSGHGHFDMQAYTDYFAGQLVDQDYDEGELKAALDALPKVAA
jgi:tryptophan synthase beta chain